MIVVFLNLIAPSLVRAQQYSSDFTVDFRWNKSFLDTLYMNTGIRLRELSDSIETIGLVRIDSVRLVSYSSPEGMSAYNARLAQKRAAPLGKYILSIYPELKGRLSIEADGESWHLFRARVLVDSTLTESQRSRLLEIIDAPIPADRKKAIIKSWSPNLWRRIIREWFPYMRRSFVRVDYLNVGAVAPLSKISSDAMAPMGNLAPRTEYEFWKYRTILALKTNLLYDAVTALNFEVEVPIGDNYSLAIEDVFPWWNWGPNGNKYCFQLWEMGIEPRYWFSKTDDRDRLSGHFLGLYGMSGKYDFQWDKSLCWQGEFWSTGLTYGYSRPIAQWCNLELSASVGFLRSDWRHYEPGVGYEHLYRDPSRTGVFSYFGPTKLKVSLVIPITVKRRAKR